MHEENQCVMHPDKPNYARVRVFDKYCNRYKEIE
jgi:hypothetical protein